jgi:hypothetical protein
MHATAVLEHCLVALPYTTAVLNLVVLDLQLYTYPDTAVLVLCPCVKANYLSVDLVRF